jgi:hypothetical protein
VVVAKKLPEYKVDEVETRFPTASNTAMVLAIPVAAPEASAPHWITPLASVSRTKLPLQVGNFESLSVPPTKSIPFANVEVARVEVMLRAFACRPKTNVEVAVVEVAKNVPE